MTGSRRWSMVACILGAAAALVLVVAAGGWWSGRTPAEGSAGAGSGPSVPRVDWSKAFGVAKRERGAGGQRLARR